MAASDRSRLSVSLVDVGAGHEAEFLALADEFEALLIAQGLRPRRDRSATRRSPLPLLCGPPLGRTRPRPRSCHARPRCPGADRAASPDRARHPRRQRRARGPTTRAPAPRRSPRARRAGSPDRLRPAGRRDVERATRERARSAAIGGCGPRRAARSARGDVDLVGAARRAREHADAAFSQFKVGAALETADGTVITGCNVENATYGLTICAERVAMFKALSEGHRAFTRIAIVADTEAPTPPCGACRQILWEFGGDLEVMLANLTERQGHAPAEGSAAAAVRRAAAVNRTRTLQLTPSSRASSSVYESSSIACFRPLPAKHDVVVMIDQRKLPAQEVYVRCKTAAEVARAIKTMVIRGAPAIGVAAAMGIALGMRAQQGDRHAEVRRRVLQDLRADGGDPADGGQPVLGDRADEAVVRRRRRRPGESVDQIKDRLDREAERDSRRGRRQLPRDGRVRRRGRARATRGSSRTATPARSRPPATARRSA